MDYNTIIQEEKPIIINNPFNLKESVAILWNNNKYQEQLKKIGLNIKDYQHPGESNVFLLNSSKKQYIVMEPKNSLDFITSKLKPSIYNSVKKEIVLLHELAHGSEYQIGDTEEVKKVRNYRDEYGRNSNANLRNEIHSDALSLMTISSKLSISEFNTVLEREIERRKKTVSNEHITFPALIIMKNNIDFFYKTNKKDNKSEILADFVANYDFGLIKMPENPYNLSQLIHKSSNIKGIIENLNNDFKKRYIRKKALRNSV